jgi:hypothetical protein
VTDDQAVIHPALVLILGALVLPWLRGNGQIAGRRGAAPGRAGIGLAGA